MAQPLATRRFALLATAVLLLGQGSALHHRHEIAADCAPGPCAEHQAPLDAVAVPVESASEADVCPFCEVLSHGRAAPAGLGVSPIAPANGGARALPAGSNPRPLLTVAPLRARAPPRPA